MPAIGRKPILGQISAFQGFDRLIPHLLADLSRMFG